MSQKITHILFATDLSRNSAHAMVHAANLAQATGARLHVLHVAEPLSDDARITLQLFLQDKTARRDAIEMRSSHLREILQERQKKFWAALPEDDRGAQELVDSIEIIEGHPAEVILRRAAELNCDLIVLGAHDHGFSRTFLGTVAKRVLRRAEIPTLVVPYIED
ncbi:universal stress protein [Amaricoccus tamworthensis]|uniref:universal stress protein n=1 Tax=Amaricoccus tamworthensis TaxID=57002 RepID=UPI003C7BBBEE